MSGLESQEIIVKQPLKKLLPRGKELTGCSHKPVQASRQMRLSWKREAAPQSELALH